MGLNLGEEISNLGLHCDVDLIGGCGFGCVLGGVGCAFVLVDLEAIPSMVLTSLIVWNVLPMILKQKESL